MKKIFIVLITLAASFSCLSQSDVKLAFHMGLGANGHYEIGGTMENNRSEILPHTAVTYITIDKNCIPSSAKVANFGPIKANDVLEFRIPIEGVLSFYRILGVSAWNTVGIPVNIEDKTADIIKSRDVEFMNNCKLKS